MAIDPATLTGLVFYSADPVGLFQFPNGTIAASVQDDRVGDRVDASGEGNNFIAGMPNGVITDATNASPIVITSAGHGLTTTNTVEISGVGGNTAANGAWAVTVLDSDTFELNTSTGNGAYTSGGLWISTVEETRPKYNEVSFGGKDYVECLHAGSPAEYLTAGNAADLDFDITDPFLIGGIFRLTDAASYQVWFNKMSGILGAYVGWYLGLDVSGVIHFNFVNIANSRLVASTTVLDADTPYVILIRNTGSGTNTGMSVWVNRLDVSNRISNTGSGFANSGAAVIGMPSDLNPIFTPPGGISHLFAAAGAFTDNQIKGVSDFLANISGAYTPPPSSPASVIYRQIICGGAS